MESEARDDRPDVDERDMLDSALGRLRWRDRELLTIRYGLGSRTALTLRELGTRLGISQECVRQHEKRALARLKQEMQR